MWEPPKRSEYGITNEDDIDDLNLKVNKKCMHVHLEQVEYNENDCIAMQSKEHVKEWRNNGQVSGLQGPKWSVEMSIFMWMSITWCDGSKDLPKGQKGNEILRYSLMEEDSGWSGELVLSFHCIALVSFDLVWLH